MVNVPDEFERENSTQELVGTTPMEQNPPLLVEPTGWKRWWHLIGVEPSMFIYMVSAFISYPAFKVLVYEMVCYNEYGDQAEICLNSSLTRKDFSIQVGSNRMVLVDNWVLTIPSLVVSSLLGSIGDKYNRKLVLLVPLVGLVLSSVITVILTAIDYKRFSVYWLLLSDVIFGCSGGFIAILGTMFAYSAALSRTKRSRSYRMAALEGSIGAGGTVGFFCSGYLVKLLPYHYVFLLVTALNVLCLIGTILFVQGTVTTLREVSTDDESIVMKAIKHLTNSVRVAFKAREGTDRMCLLLLLAAITITFTVFDGSGDILYYYMKYQLGWTAVEYGKFGSVVYLFGTFAILVLFPLMRRYLLSDYKLAMFGMVSKGIGCVMLAFVFADWFAYTITVVYALNRFASAALRSLSSQMVTKDELGQIFALVSLLQGLCTMLASVLFNNLMPYTLSFFPGLSFCVMVLLLLIAIACVVSVQCIRARVHLDPVQTIALHPKPPSSPQ